MLVGFYGGTFDPIHVGHTHAAVTVKDALGLDQVRMVLAARPGHRGVPGESPEHRWAMLQLACGEIPGLVPDDCELHRRGKSYTVDTLIAACRADSAAVPCWILGQDAFATLPIWHRWQDLLTYCNLIVVERPPEFCLEPEEVQALCQSHEVNSFDSSRVGQIFRLHEPMQVLSATEIRRRIGANESVEDLLAGPVNTYIRQHRLYQRTENSI